MNSDLENGILDGTYDRVLNIPDRHEPFSHPDAFYFIQAVAQHYGPDLVIDSGDEIDGHCWSYHNKNPNIGHSSSSELELAIEKNQKYYQFFNPYKYHVMDSNHGSLVARKGHDAGLPHQALRTNIEILKVPGWSYHAELVVRMSDGRRVLFCHGKSGAIGGLAKEVGMCTVEGHYHEKFGISRWWGGYDKPMWAVQGGCLVDDKALAMFYNKTFKKRPQLGCTMILQGNPILIPLELDKHRRWTGQFLRA